MNLISQIIGFLPRLWEYLPKINLLLGTCTSAFVLSKFMGLVNAPFDITLPPENILTIPNMGILLLFLLTFLYVIKYEDLKEEHHKILNTAAFMTMMAALGAFFFAPLFSFSIPVVYEKPHVDTISRGIVVTCSCYLQNPTTYAQCVNGQIKDCHNIMCERPGDIICNNRFLWMCGDDRKLHVTTCARGCKADRTGCVEEPIELVPPEKCTEGTKCVNNIVYVCTEGVWSPYKECPAGCNYAGTNCALEPVIITEKIN